MLEVRPYKKGDVYEMPVHPGDRMGGEPESNMNDLAVTLLLEHQPVACVGIVIVSQGVGHAWSYMTSGLGECKIELIKLIRREIPIIMRNVGIHRLQVTIQAHMYNNVRFAELLGFREEGILRAAAPNKVDLRMMAIVRK